MDIHSLRTGTLTRDRAILDLLHLQELGLVPGSIRTQRLQELWGTTQPQVSRRMAAVHQLGVLWVKPGHGRYKLFDGHDLRAQRWERLRQRVAP